MPKKSPKPITPEQLAASCSEDGHQMALMCWASSPHTQAIYPDLKWLFHIPNGGLRNKVTAARLRAMGTKRGVPDLCLAVRRGEFAALWIEMKVPKRADGRRAGAATSEQSIWIKHLHSQGHGAIVCKGWDEARQTIIKYLNYGK